VIFFPVRAGGNRRVFLGLSRKLWLDLGLSSFVFHIFLW
jgi:hypothetical protein